MSIRTINNFSYSLELLLQNALDYRYTAELPQNVKEDDKNLDFSKDGRGYRSNLYLVLKELSFEIQSIEKVCCVGRTGNGKSSNIQAIFRMSEIEDLQESKLLISDQDIRKLGLHKVRSNIGIIPNSNDKKKFRSI